MKSGFKTPGELHCQKVLNLICLFLNMFRVENVLSYDKVVCGNIASCLNWKYMSQSFQLFGNDFPTYVRRFQTFSGEDEVFEKYISNKKSYYYCFPGNQLF